MSNEKNRVAFISVLAAIFLTGFKLVVGLITGSLGILSEALHSGLDLVAAVITLFAVRISAKPADREHHYGHGKVENLSALIETLLLFITCFWIIYEAVHRLVTGKTDIEVTVWSYVVVITSILIDLSRSRALSRVAKKYNSQALEADALHFSTDIWSSAVVLLGLICANFGFFFADSVAALVVAMIVIFVCYKLGKRSVDMLLDRATPNLQEKAEQAIRRIPEVTRFHDLRLRSSGADNFIEVCIHVDPMMGVGEAHLIAHRVADSIKGSISHSRVTVHAEPESPDDF